MNLWMAPGHPEGKAVLSPADEDNETQKGCSPKPLGQRMPAACLRTCAWCGFVD